MVFTSQPFNVKFDIRLYSLNDNSTCTVRNETPLDNQYR